MHESFPHVLTCSIRLVEPEVEAGHGSRYDARVLYSRDGRIHLDTDLRRLSMDANVVRAWSAHGGSRYLSRGIRLGPLNLGAIWLARSTILNAGPPS